MVVRPSRILRVLGVALALAFWAWNFLSSQRELQQARSEWSALVARKAELQDRALKLRREVNSLKYHKESLARLAKEILGVADPKEVVVIVPGFSEGERQVQ